MEVEKGGRLWTHTNAARPDGASVPAEESTDVPREAVELEESFKARDGTLLHQRAIHPDDAGRLQAFHSRLSTQAIIYRFFGTVPKLGSELAGRLSHVDYENRMAIVATQGEGKDEPIIAVVRYQRETPEAAEIALVVEDRWQGQGIALHLLWALAAYARRRGFTALVARVMYQNEHMLVFLRHSGFPTVYDMVEGSIEARLDITDLDTPQPLVWDKAP